MEFITKATLNQIKFDQNLSFDSNYILRYIDFQELNSTNIIGPHKTIIINDTAALSVSSIKAYNIFKINQYNFMKMILSLAGNAGKLINPNPLGILTGLFSLIRIFLDNIKIDLNDSDAKVLLCIYRLGQSCAISTIFAEYNIIFNETIRDASLKASLKNLECLRIIKSINGEVEIIESVIINRDSI